MQTGSIHITGDARIQNENLPVARVKVKAPDSSSEKAAGTGELLKLKAVLAQRNISLKFSRDEATKQVVVEMIDQKTGEAVRQFPTEVSLSLAANFMRLQGVFLNVHK